MAGMVFQWYRTVQLTEKGQGAKMPTVLWTQSRVWPGRCRGRGRWAVSGAGSPVFPFPSLSSCGGVLSTLLTERALPEGRLLLPLINSRGARSWDLMAGKGSLCLSMCVGPVAAFELDNQAQLLRIPADCCQGGF